MTLRSIQSLFVIIIAAGCQSSVVGEQQGTPIEPPADADGSSTVHPLAGPEALLETAMDRTRLAFREQDGQFRAKHTTHHVSAVRGVVEITPFHHLDGAVQQGAPFTIETREIRRGGDAKSTKYRTTRIDATSGDLHVERASTTEIFSNREEGVEQSWKFESEPHGTGPLTVRVAVSGHAFVSETQAGLHFATPGKLGFRYGHATWIDADGVPTSINARWEKGEIQITVPGELVASSAYPAVLDPVVTAEEAVDNPVNGWTGTAGLRSSIAWSGAQGLVVWSDARNGVSSDIYGTRIDAAGTVLDSVGIAISTASGVQDNPTVAFIDGEYVVAWDTDGATLGAARVSTAGVVSSLASPGAGRLPDLASRGASGLLVYLNGTDVRAASYAGGSLGSAFSVTSGAAANTPAVAGNAAGDYLVTWSEGATTPDLMGQFASSAGALSGAAFAISAAPGGQNDADVAFNGTDFVTVWSNNRLGVDLYGARVSTAGVVLDMRTDGSTTVGGVPLVTAANNQVQPSIACSGATCLATWTDRRDFATNLNDVYAVRLDGSLAVVGETAVAVLPDEQRNPGLTSTGTGWRLSWHDKRHGGPDAVFTARVEADGSTPDGSGANVVRGNNRQVRPTMTSSTNNWLAAWSDSRTLGADIMGARFSGAGVKLDAVARTINTSAGQQGNPSVSFNGADYLAVWNDTRNGTEQDIYAARMTVTGSVVDGAGFAVSTAAGDQLRPSVATSTSGTSLVVWQDSRAGFEVYGALVNGGSTTMMDIAVCAGVGAQLDPSVAYDATNDLFVVTWNDDRSGTDDVYAARVTPAGTVLDPCGVVVSAAAGTQTQPKITAHGGGGFYIVWTDRRTDAAGDVYGARLTASSTAITILDTAGTPIAVGPPSQGEPDVAFVQPNVNMVVWAENGDIMGGVVLPTGAVDGANFVISANADVESGPAVTAGPSGKPAMVAYERQASDLATMRVATRRITFSGTSGSTCSNDSQCVSGFCVDGFCCDQACGGNDTTDCQACSVQRGAAQNGVCGVIINTNYTCRYYNDFFCDRLEKCDGVNTTCPPDLGRRQGISCTTADNTTGTCPANDETGAPHVCQ